MSSIDHHAQNCLYFGSFDVDHYVSLSDHFAAVLGFNLHVSDVYLAIGRVDGSSMPFLTSAHRAEWLEDWYPSLVPPPQNGVPPSEQTLALIFGVAYFEDPRFIATYRRWFYGQLP